MRGSARWAVLLRNLADNALRYGGGDAGALAAQVLLRVEDSGPGPQTSSATHLGERFFRVFGRQAAGWAGRSSSARGGAWRGGHDRRSAALGAGGAGGLPA